MTLCDRCKVRTSGFRQPVVFTDPRQCDVCGADLTKVSAPEVSVDDSSPIQN